VLAAHGPMRQAKMRKSTMKNMIWETARFVWNTIKFVWTWLWQILAVITIALDIYAVRVLSWENFGVLCSLECFVIDIIFFGYFVRWAFKVLRILWRHGDQIMDWMIKEY
jgi:hypothetical protein